MEQDGKEKDQVLGNGGKDKDPDGSEDREDLGGGNPCCSKEEEDSEEKEDKKHLSGGEKEKEGGTVGW